MRTYLSANEETVLTDYSVLAPEVIAGHLPLASTRVPGKTAPLILTCAGGEIVLDGVRVNIHDGHNYDRINDGSDYLLFLRPSRRQEAGRYEVYYGGIFEISQGEYAARPSMLLLDVDSERRIFVGGDVIELARGTLRL